LPLVHLFEQCTFYRQPFEACNAIHRSNYIKIRVK
jgi:hypothetical protein